MEADPNTYVDSDHFALLADIQIKLKANHSQQKNKDQNMNSARRKNDTTLIGDLRKASRETGITG